MSKDTAKKEKRSVLDYGMEWFDYHLTVGVYISVAISLLLWIFVFLGKFYRTDLYNSYSGLTFFDTCMWIYYLVYTVAVFLTRKIFLEGDTKSFHMFQILFIIRVVFHAFMIFELMVPLNGILESSIFYRYIYYFAIAVVAVNVVNIVYFIKRKKIFEI